MPTVTAAFAHALVSAVGLTLCPDGRILSNQREVHRLALRADGQLDDQTHFDLIDWICGGQPDRLSLAAAYAGTIRLDDLGVLGLALKTAPTLRASLQRMARYYHVITDTAVYHLDETATPPRLILEGLTVDHPALTLRNECALAALVYNARRFVQEPPRFAGVTFRHDCLGDPEAYAAWFGCSVRFGAAQDALLLTPEALDLPNRLGDAALSAFMAAQLDSLAPAEPQRPLRSDLMHRLSTSLSTGVPQAADMAHAMGLSERTFFRRLADEGTSFREVVRDAQVGLACDLLERGGCSIAEVAFLTGFAEQSSFGRAFKRWVGVAPAQYRARKAEAGYSARPEARDVAADDRPGGALTADLGGLAGAAQRLAGRVDTLRAPAG